MADINERVHDLELLAVTLTDLVLLDLHDDGALARLDPIGRERFESLVALRHDIGRRLAEEFETPKQAADG